MIMWTRFKQDFKERFLNFETAKGVYLVPASLIGLYISFFQQQYFIQGFGAIFFGYWFYEGLRKILVNRIKEGQAKHKLAVEREELDSNA